MSELREVLAANAAPALAIGGLLIGFVFGAILQRTGFCAMGGVSDWHTFGDSRRLRAWFLAAAVATLAAQALDHAGVTALDRSMYLAPSLNWAGNLVGGVLFGIGMVLAGGCASRNIVRAGTGDLRAGLTIVVMGLAAFAAIGGVLGPARAAFETATAVDLSRAGLANQSLTAALARAGGLGSDAARWLATAIVAGGLSAWCLSSRAFRASPVHILSGVGVGLCIAAGWMLSGLAFDELASRPQPPVSLTFVRPAGDTLDWLQRATALGLPGFGVASVAGTLLGAFAAAMVSGRLRLATFADTGDTLRHLGGAALMGIGGVMALGCTVGQGITGLSTLSIGAALALAAIVVGGVIGLRLMERLA